MRRGVVVLLGSCVPLAACAMLIGVEDASYRADDGGRDASAVDAPSLTKDARPDQGEQSPPDAGPVDASTASIACQADPCVAASQQCCIAWAGGGTDTCAPGHGPPCTIDGSTETSTIACDDPSDCLAWASPGATVCCLTTGGRFTSTCVLPGNCSGASKRVMCDPTTGAGCDASTCGEFADNPLYSVCP